MASTPGTAIPFGAHYVLEDLDEDSVPPPIGSSRKTSARDLRATRQRNTASIQRESISEAVDSTRPQSQTEDGEICSDRYGPRANPGYNPTTLLSSPAITLLTKVYTVSYLVFFSIWGTLARLGLQWLTFYPGAPIVTPVVWANFGGSFIMGFLAEDEILFHDGWLLAPSHTREASHETTFEKVERAKRKKIIPLYIGLTTGFCGSFTSFSSFARDFFLALSNDLPTPVNHPYSTSSSISTTSTVNRAGGYLFLAFLGVVIYTIALSLGGLILGGHMSHNLDRIIPRLSVKWTRKFVDPLSVVLGFGCWIGALFLAIWPPDRPDGPASRASWDLETWRGEVLFSLVLAPLGCLLRFYVSLKLNGLVQSFPLGTFTVNMFGTAVEAMCWDIQHVKIGVLGAVGGGRVGCQMLQGVMDGFCGCLTTVSTWVAEIHGLRQRHGYYYTVGSVLGALGLTVMIMGSVRWTVGWMEPDCSTGYTSKVHG